MRDLELTARLYARPGTRRARALHTRLRRLKMRLRCRGSRTSVFVLGFDFAARLTGSQLPPLGLDHLAQIVEQLRVALGQDFPQIPKGERRSRTRIQQLSQGFAGNLLV